MKASARSVSRSLRTRKAIDSIPSLCLISLSGMGGSSSSTSLPISSTHSGATSITTTSYSTTSISRRFLQTAIIRKNNAGEEEEMVLISKARLDQLLESEIVHCSLQKPRKLTLDEVLCIKSLTGMRRLLAEELPVRHAVRIKLIESVPGWEIQKNLRHVRRVYSDSFKAVRLAREADEDEFRDVIFQMKRKHGYLVNHLVVGMHELRDQGKMSSEQIDHFMGAFFVSRMGTESLTNHFLAMSEGGHQSGIIDEDLDPKQIILAAATEAMELCANHYRDVAKVIPPKVVLNCKRGVSTLKFIPEYLHYCSLELIKNSMRAVVERHIFEQQAGGGKNGNKAILGGTDESPGAESSKSGTNKTNTQSGSDESDDKREIESRVKSTDDPWGEKEGGTGTVTRNFFGRLSSNDLKNIPSHLQLNYPLRPDRFHDWVFPEKQESQDFSHASQHAVYYDVHEETSRVELVCVGQAAEFLPSVKEDDHPQFLPPIEIDLCGDDRNVTMRISDKGGSVPRHLQDKIWSYLYTTAKPITVLGDDDVLPMAGFGCGLPLTKAYLNWVGGTIDMVCLPQYGTDVYVNLPRLGDAQEAVLSGNQIPGREMGWMLDSDPNGK